MPPIPDLLGNDGLVVLSPHLDDAALSVGATIARASREGRRVKVVTVLAGDPATDAPAGEWDRRCGFSSAGEAVRARRAEDEAACEILGAEPIWLPYGDEQHGRGAGDDEVWQGLAPIVADAHVVLVPGYPLEHADHAWLTVLVLERFSLAPVALYVEQPYAADLAIGRGHSLRPLLRAGRVAIATRAARRPVAAGVPEQVAHLLANGVRWQAVRPTRNDRKLKERAIRAYATQFGVDRLGRRLLTRIRLYETVTGGEQLGLAHTEDLHPAPSTAPAQPR
ncbi:MAG: PIG-L deacetylase family protein [Gaiellaceae bacterium]